MIIAGNQQLLKSVNRMSIVRKIRMTPGISRADLAEQVMLTKSTVGKLVEELIEEGWLTESSVVVTGALGRRPIPLAVDSTRRLLVGASINGIRSELVAVSLKGDVRAVDVVDASGSPEQVLDILAGQIRNLHHQLNEAGQQIAGIGVAVPGPVRPDSGVLRHSESTGWKEVPIREMLRARLNALGLPEFVLVVERAVGCIALQHFEFERVADEEPLLYVHVGYGIAAAAVSSNRVVRGHQGLAGYCAHLPLEPDGPICDCGQRGCANVVVTLRAAEAALGCNAEDIRARISKDDPGTAAVLRQVGARLGTFLFNLRLQYDPARLFVGGPAFQFGDAYLEGAQSQFDALARDACVSPARLRVMRSDWHNIALGASTVVLHTLLSAKTATNHVAA